MIEERLDWVAVARGEHSRSRPNRNYSACPECQWLGVETMMWEDHGRMQVSVKSVCDFCEWSNRENWSFREVEGAKRNGNVGDRPVPMKNRWVEKEAAGNIGMVKTFDGMEFSPDLFMELYGHGRVEAL